MPLKQRKMKRTKRADKARKDSEDRGRDAGAAKDKAADKAGKESGDKAKDTGAAGIRRNQSKNHSWVSNGEKTISSSSRL